MNIKVMVKQLMLVLIIVTLSACTATHTAINKRNLNVQTKMSETIFLTPASPANKTVFVQIKNTSDKEIELNSEVASAIAKKGYKVVEDPSQANYWVQANILQVGQVDLRAADQALSQGYGSSLDGAITGGLIGVAANNNTSSMIVGGLLGAGISTVGNALVKDVSYSIITDIQISEKTNATVDQKTQSNLKQGTNGNVEIKALEKTNWKRYQTRILSTANKVNLKFEEAAPELIAGLSRSISGLM